jgi:hypothetical protein
VNLGPVVLFSAAIPYQGGTHHVNEQWPEYWAGNFEAKGSSLRPITSVGQRICESFGRIWKVGNSPWRTADRLLVSRWRNLVRSSSPAADLIGISDAKAKVVAGGQAD